MVAESRKALLTLHVATSVAWLGSVVAFLALALDGLAAATPVPASPVYVSMELITLRVIVPLCAATVVTGGVQSLVSSWGFFRHYWVIVKLVITVVSTGLLLLHLSPIRALAMAARAGSADSSLGRMKVQLVVTAGAAIAALLLATALSVLKPRGVTLYGWRKEQAAKAARNGL